MSPSEPVVESEYDSPGYGLIEEFFGMFRVDRVYCELSHNRC